MIGCIVGVHRSGGRVEGGGGGFRHETRLEVSARGFTECTFTAVYIFFMTVCVIKFKPFKKYGGV